MWGTQVLQRHQSALRRFIPTHVGNTSLQTDSHCYPAVHPHACGEHRTEEITQRVEDGSSPRMWGTPSAPGMAPPPARFIPTHVGNTSVGIEHCDIWAVHPHACGEHLKAVAWVDKVDGSSPRMWGTLEGVGSENEAIRFIPTHVGNTNPLPIRGNPVAVHPHACGKHCCRRYAGFRRVGSSPRMWGTPARCRRSTRRCGFIPTHVGNTAAWIRQSRSSAVHPHACGEHFPGLGRGVGVGGSSPRMWGTRVV